MMKAFYNGQSKKELRKEQLRIYIIETLIFFFPKKFCWAELCTWAWFDYENQSLRELIESCKYTLNQCIKESKEIGFCYCRKFHK